MTNPANESAILVRAEGESWREPSQAGYLSEADMQEMLAEQPSLIPGVGHQALAAREFYTGVGPSDVVVVDLDGTITLVECKLASNVEIRRKIVGQVLDYAARMWRMPLTDFEARWKQCSAGVGVLDRLEEEAASALAPGLQDGAFRLVLAVDVINEDLRQIVEFLNAHTNDQVTVLALELRRVRHGGVDILTPRTFGGELARAKQVQAKRNQRSPWSLEDVRTALAEVERPLCDLYDRLTTDLLALGFTANGTAAGQPSMTYKFIDPDGTPTWPLAVYSGSSPVLNINFAWTATNRPEVRSQFLDAIGDLGGALDPTAIRQANLNKRPGVPLALLADAGHYDRVLTAARLLTEPVE